MTQDIISVARREKVGKASSRELRKQGLIPASIYGLNEPPASVSISAKVVARVLSSDTGVNSMLHLQREGTDIKRHVIIKEIQRNPINGRLCHVDFMRVDPTHKVKVHVPIVLTGTPEGVKEGGILDFVHRQIEVECLPAFIPGHIDIDVSEMKVGDMIRLDQVKIDSHLALLGDAHNVICAVHGVKPEEEAAAPAAEEVKEPEIVAAKGKKEAK